MTTSVWKNCHRPSLILSTPQLHDDFYSQPISWGIDQIVITLPQRFVAFPASSPQDFVDMTAQDLFYGNNTSNNHIDTQKMIPENVRVFRSALICTTGGGGGGGGTSNNSNNHNTNENSIFGNFFCNKSNVNNIPQIDDSLFLGTTSSMIAHCVFTESSVVLNRKLRISPLVGPQEYFNARCYTDPSLEDGLMNDDDHNNNNNNNNNNNSDEDDRPPEEDEDNNNNNAQKKKNQRDRDDGDENFNLRAIKRKFTRRYLPLCGITCMSQCGPSRSPCEIVAGTADGIVAIFDIRVPSPFPVLEFGKRSSSSSSSSNASDHNNHNLNLNHHPVIMPNISLPNLHERAHPPCSSFSHTAVTGLAVDSFGSGMIASGGNDGVVHIWNPSASNIASSYQPLATIQRGASAVRALSWCPTKKGLLAIGGGAADCSLSLVDCSSAVSGPDHASQSDHYHFYSKSKNSCFHQQAASAAVAAATASSGNNNGGSSPGNHNCGGNPNLIILGGLPSSSSIPTTALVSTSSTSIASPSSLNITTSKVSIQTGSQISQVLWSHDGNFLVSSHGYEFQSLIGNNNDNGNNQAQNSTGCKVPAFNLAVWKVKDYGSSLSLLAHNQQINSAESVSTNRDNNNTISKNNNNGFITNILALPPGQNGANLSRNKQNNTNNNFDFLSPGTRNFLSSLNDDNHTNGLFPTTTASTSNKNPLFRFLHQRENENNTNDISRTKQLSSSSSFIAPTTMMINQNNRLVPNTNSAFSRLNMDNVASNSSADFVEEQKAIHNNNFTASSSSSSSAAALLNFVHSSNEEEDDEDVGDESSRTSLTTPPPRSTAVVQVTQNIESTTDRKNIQIQQQLGGVSLPRNCPAGWFDIPYRDYLSQRIMLHQQRNRSNASLLETSNNQTQNANPGSLLHLLGSEGAASEISEYDYLHHHHHNNNNNQENENVGGGAANGALRSLGTNSNSYNSQRPKFSALLSASHQHQVVAAACLQLASQTNTEGTRNNNANTQMQQQQNATARLDSIAKLIGHTCRPLFLVQRQSIKTLLVQHKTSKKICDAATSLMSMMTTTVNKQASNKNNNNNSATSTTSWTGGEFISGAGGLDSTVRLWELFDDKIHNVSSGGGVYCSSANTSPVDEVYYQKSNNENANNNNSEKKQTQQQQNCGKFASRKKVFGEEEVDFGTMLR